MSVQFSILRREKTGSDTMVTDQTYSWSSHTLSVILFSTQSYTHTVIHQLHDAILYSRVIPGLGPYLTRGGGHVVSRRHKIIPYLVMYFLLRPPAPLPPPLPPPCSTYCNLQAGCQRQSCMVHGVVRSIITQPLLSPPCYNTCGINLVLLTACILTTILQIAIQCFCPCTLKFKWWY